MFFSYGLLGKCLMIKETRCLGREISSVASINKDGAGRRKVVGKIDVSESKTRRRALRKFLHSLFAERIRCRHKVKHHPTAKSRTWNRRRADQKTVWNERKKRRGMMEAQKSNKNEAREGDYSNLATLHLVFPTVSFWFFALLCHLLFFSCFFPGFPGLFRFLTTWVGQLFRFCCFGLQVVHFSLQENSHNILEKGE